MSETIRFPLRWRAIRDALGRNSRSEIRVLCPRGHFIVNVQIIVPERDISGGDDPAIVIMPRGPEGQTLGDVYNQDNAQFQIHTGDGPKYRIRLRCRRCHYSGSVSYDGLAADLAAARSSGHSEHRLTS